MDSQSTYPPVLASSQDSTQLSLTISSASKMVLFLVATYAAHKGLNPDTATNQVQALIDLGVGTAPLILAVYHAVMTGWGLIRKILSYWKTPSIPVV